MKLSGVRFGADRRRRGGTTHDPVVVIRSVLSALQVGIVLLDPSGQVVFANPAAYALGVLRRSTMGDQVNATLLAAAEQVRRNGRSQCLELDLPRGGGVGGGKLEPSGADVRVVRVDSGHVVIEATDVTEAHRLARVRRDFVANVSHELKTPVGALGLLAEALIEAVGEPDSSDDDSAAVLRFAKRIKHESTRLSRLIGDLLELTRLQGAQPLPEPTPVAVDHVIAEVMDRTSTTAAARGIAIVVEGERGLTTWGIEDQCRTALANLVENAVAYSPGGTQVTIGTRQDGDVVDIAVIDQGIGIAPKDIDRIFERFYRADKARSRVTGGTGLGLAIVKHIATNHGGRVDVRSTLGEGSTFTLRLPGRPPDTVREYDVEGGIDSGGIRLGRL